MRTGRLRGWQISKAYHEYRPGAAQGSPARRPHALRLGVHVRRADCIRTKDTAYTPDGGLAILYGQLAPEGSVVKTAGISDEFKKNCGPGFVFEGPCVIFESQDDACAGILAGKVKAGDVVDHPQRRAARRSGHAGNALAHQLHRRHGPGRQGARSSPTAVSAAARRAPASATSRPRRRKAARSACSRHGDRIRIDFPNRRIDILVPEAELAERKKTWQPVKRELTGWLARYQKLVTNASQGGILSA